MRRLFAVAAIGVAFFAMTACADVPQDEPGASPKPTNVKLADKKTTCDAYLKLDAEVEGKITSLALAVQSAQNDPVKAATALSEGMATLSDYQTKTAALEAQAGDAEVKAALKAEADATKKLQADITAAGSDPAKIQAAIQGADKAPGEKLESLCGK